MNSGATARGLQVADGSKLPPESPEGNLPGHWTCVGYHLLRACAAR
jgi:hypothetical protein